MGIPDHLACLLRNLFAGQEELELDMEQQIGSKLQHPRLHHHLPEFAQTHVTIHSDYGTQENKVCHCFIVFPSICCEVMGSDAMI